MELEELYHPDAKAHIAELEKKYNEALEALSNIKIDILKEIEIGMKDVLKGEISAEEVLSDLKDSISSTE